MIYYIDKKQSKRTIFRVEISGDNSYIGDYSHTNYFHADHISCRSNVLKSDFSNRKKSQLEKIERSCMTSGQLFSNSIVLLQITDNHFGQSKPKIWESCFYRGITITRSPESSMSYFYIFIDNWTFPKVNFEL